MVRRNRSSRSIKRMTAGIFCAVFSVCLASQSGFCQHPEKSIGKRAAPTSCEENIATLEAAHHRANNNTHLLLIGHLGINEKDVDHNRLRLYNAVAYLSDYTGLRKKSTIVVAEGKRDPKRLNGSIEIYVEGKLFGELIVKEGSYLRVGSCEPQEIETPEQVKKRSYLFPWVDKEAALKDW